MHAKYIRSSAKREIQTEWSAKRVDRIFRPRRGHLARDENVPAKRADFSW